MNDNEIKMINDEDLEFIVGGATSGTYAKDLSGFIQHMGAGSQKVERFSVTYGSTKGDTTLSSKMNFPINDKAFSRLIEIAGKHGGVTFHSSDGKSQTFTAAQLGAML